MCSQNSWEAFFSWYTSVTIHETFSMIGDDLWSMTVFKHSTLSDIKHCVIIFINIWFHHKTCLMMRKYSENRERYGRLRSKGFKLNLLLKDLSLDPLQDKACPFACVLFDCVCCKLYFPVFGHGKSCVWPLTLKNNAQTSWTIRRGSRIRLGPGLDHWCFWDCASIQ